jgi:hypothetical protein
MTKKLISVCSVRDCKAVVSALGYCNHHYQMMHRWGNTDGNKLKCAICSKEFLKKAGRQLTCSKQCSSEYRKQFMKEFRSKQPTVRKQAKCTECGKSFLAKTYQKTCSDLCRTASRRRYEDERAKRRRKPISTQKCEWCDKRFKPKTHSKTCSPRCRALYTQARRTSPGQALKPRACVVCGTWFKVGVLNNRTITCSADCRGKRASRLMKKKADKYNQLRRGSRARSSNLKRRFGITEADYQIMLKGQKGKCAICGTREPGTAGVFAVDHDHRTGKVRGLLCRSCNVGIGNLKDDPNLLQAAVSYLRPDETIHD